MLTEQEIQQALHAWRVIPLPVSNPHGPLGLEQVAAAVSAIADSPLLIHENKLIRVENGQTQLRQRRLR
jgi:hypothetical protein